MQKAKKRPLKRTKLISRRLKFAGRNTILKRELLEEIIEYVGDGLPVAPTCDIVGIAYESWSNWLNWGRKYLSGDGPEEHEIFGEFVERIAKARGMWQHRITQRSLMCEEYKVGWVRDITILERRDRENWGRQDTVRIDDSKYDPDDKFL